MRVLLLCVSLLWCASPRIARSEPAPTQAVDPKVEARKYFQAGVALQKTDDFHAAADAYETSLQLFATKSALFNLANCQRAMHQYAEAWHSLQRLHEQFGSELTEPMLSTSKTQLEELANLTGLVMVETQPPGALVTLDDKDLGPAPTQAPSRLAIGQHTVKASLEGYVTAENAFKLSPRQSLTLSLTLAEAPPTPVTPAAEPKTEAPTPAKTAAVTASTAQKPSEASQSRTPWMVLGWVGVGAGALSVAVGARAGVLALDVDEQLSDVCAGGHCSERYSSTVQRLERLTLSANVFVGAGAALMATGAVLLLLPPFQQESGSLRASVGPTSLLIEGRF